MEIIFATGNNNKFREAQQILNEYKLTQVVIEIPEIQGDIQEIAREKAKEAAKILNKPVLVEDTGLQFHSWNNLPGPYIKDFITKLGTKGLVQCLEGFEDKTATSITVVAFCIPGKEPLLFEGTTVGSIVSPRGKETFGWDSIFLPKGYEKTYGEMSSKEKNMISQRRKALLNFKSAKIDL